MNLFRIMKGLEKAFLLGGKACNVREALWIAASLK